MNADGSNQMQLTNTPDIEREPKLSPDGTQIVFVRGNGRSGGFPDVPNGMIWVVKSDGSNATSVCAPAVPDGASLPRSSATTVIRRVLLTGARSRSIARGSASP